MPKVDKAQQPYVFYFNKYFESAGFVAGAQLLEKMLENHDSVQEGKDDREEASKAKVSIRVNTTKVGVSKVKVGPRTKEEEKLNQQLQREIHQ